MSGKANPSTAIVKEAMARFPHLPNQTLARYLLYNYPGTFQSLEHVRRIIRYYYGDSGAKDREKRPKVNRVVQMPFTWRKNGTPGRAFGNWRSSSTSSSMRGTRLSVFSFGSGNSR